MSNNTKIQKVIGDLSVLQESARLEQAIDPGAIESIIDHLFSINKAAEDEAKIAVEKTEISNNHQAMKALREASMLVSDIEQTIKSGYEVHDQDVQSLRSVLDKANAFDSQREGVVVTKHEGMIVCVSWQDDEGEVFDLIAESETYPEMKAREAQALETIQNLVGAFDNPITRRKATNALTAEALRQGRAYIEQHAPDEEASDNDGL